MQMAQASAMCFHRTLAGFQFNGRLLRQNSDAFSIFMCCGILYVVDALLRFFTQRKSIWSEMDVIILIKEFFHIQIHISEFKHFIKTRLQKQSR